METNMLIDNSHPNYWETLSQIDELKCLIKKLEKNLWAQIPQGITNEFEATKKDFMNWVEEAEFTIGDYLR